MNCRPLFAIFAFLPALASAQTVISGTSTDDTNTASHSIGVSGSFILNAGSTYQLNSAIDAHGIRINSTNVTLSLQGTLVTERLLSTDSDAAALRVTGGGTNGIVVNVGSLDNPTALILSKGNDAIKFTGVGISMANPNIVNNHGIIRSEGRVNTSGGSPTETYRASDAITMGLNTTLNNHGVVSGARHGIDGEAIGVAINNYAGGVLVGRNGSGIGADTTSSIAADYVINNWGIIRGDYAGAGNIFDRHNDASLNGDGDGVDIDGAATINNHATGEILSTGAGGYDSGGRANNSEAISIGGGIIVNDGLIQGAGRGIVVNNDSVGSRSGAAGTTITNNAGATIEGLNGFAIRLENKLGDANDNDTIINAGTIIGGGDIPQPDAVVTLQNGAVDPHSTGTLDGISYTGTGLARFIRGEGSAVQMGEGDDTLTNTGTIDGSATGRAVNMEGGSDTVNLNGGTITGAINGGAGADTLNLAASVTHASEVQNFETFNVAAGRATLSGIVDGTTLAKTGNGILALSGANRYTGDTTIGAGTLLVNNSAGSGTGGGAVTVNTGATLGGAGAADGLVTIEDGAHLAPGDGVGTLTLNGGLTLQNGAVFDFQLGGTDSDFLLLTGGILTGADFGSLQLNLFDAGDFGAGTYNLFDFSNATTVGFESTDFVFGSVIAGYDYSLAVSAGVLQLTASAIPEPSTYAAIFGAIALAGAIWRGRRKRLPE